MVKLNIVNANTEIDGVTYAHKNCVATRNRDYACNAKNEDGVSIPSILSLNSPYGYTYFNDEAPFKLNLNNFGPDLSVRGYFNQYGTKQETILMIFNQDLKHAHTFIANGHQELKKSTIFGKETDDLISGLTKEIDGVTYYNSRCDRVKLELKCNPVTIDGALKPTIFYVRDLKAGKDGAVTKIEAPLPEDFIINVANLNVTKDVDISVKGKDKTEFGFKNADGKLVHNVILDMPVDEVMKLDDNFISHINDMPYIFARIENGKNAVLGEDSICFDGYDTCLCIA